MTLVWSTSTAEWRMCPHRPRPVLQLLAKLLLQIPFHHNRPALRWTGRTREPTFMKTWIMYPLIQAVLLRKVPSQSTGVCVSQHQSIFRTGQVLEKSRTQKQGARADSYSNRRRSSLRLKLNPKTCHRPKTRTWTLESAVQSSSHYRSEALLKWQSILVLLYTSGTVHYTVCQYGAICNLINWQASMF
jgi:hypothetical protein